MTATLLLASLFVGDYGLRSSASDGGGVVAWIGTDSSGNATSVKLSNSATISPPSGTTLMGSCDVDVDASGNYAVVFAASNSSTGVSAIYLSLNGGTPVSVGTTTNNHLSTFGRVAMHGGHLMVLWHAGSTAWGSAGATYPWGSLVGTPPQAQVFDYSTGATSTSTTYTSFEVSPSGFPHYASYALGDVCVDTSNRFAVTYIRAQQGSGAQCTRGVCVVGYTYNSSQSTGLTSRYTETSVNGTLGNSDFIYAVSSVAAFNDGGCVVVYCQGQSTPTTLVAQRFNNSGVAVSGSVISFINLSYTYCSGTKSDCMPVMGNPGRWSLNSDLGSDTTTHSYILSWDTLKYCQEHGGNHCNYGGYDLYAGSDIFYTIIASDAVSTANYQTTQVDNGSANVTFFGGTAVSSPSTGKISYEVGLGRYPVTTDSVSPYKLLGLGNACSCN